MQRCIIRVLYKRYWELYMEGKGEAVLLVECLVSWFEKVVKMALRKRGWWREGWRNEEEAEGRKRRLEDCRKSIIELQDIGVLLTLLQEYDDQWPTFTLWGKHRCDSIRENDGNIYVIGVIHWDCVSMTSYFIPR